MVILATLQSTGIYKIQLIQRCAPVAAPVLKSAQKVRLMTLSKLTSTNVSLTVIASQPVLVLVLLILIALNVSVALSLT